MLKNQIHEYWQFFYIFTKITYIYLFYNEKEINYNLYINVTHLL